MRELDRTCVSASSRRWLTGTAVFAVESAPTIPVSNTLDWIGRVVYNPRVFLPLT
jgi:hypothetical protein